MFTPPSNLSLPPEMFPLLYNMGFFKKHVNKVFEGRERIGGGVTDIQATMTSHQVLFYIYNLYVPTYMYIPT